MNSLPEDNSHEISGLIWLASAAKKLENIISRKILGGTLSVKVSISYLYDAFHRQFV